MDSEPNAEPIDFSTLTPEAKLNAIFAALCDIMGRLDLLEAALTEEEGYTAEEVLALFDPECPAN